jgi:hypothetical protein
MAISIWATLEALGARSVVRVVVDLLEPLGSCHEVLMHAGQSDPTTRSVETDTNRRSAEPDGLDGALAALRAHEH